MKTPDDVYDPGNFYEGKKFVNELFTDFKETYRLDINDTAFLFAHINQLQQQVERLTAEANQARQDRVNVQLDYDKLQQQIEQFRTDVTEFSVSQDMAGTSIKAQQRLQSIISAYGQSSAAIKEKIDE